MSRDDLIQRRRLYCADKLQHHAFSREAMRAIEVHALLRSAMNSTSMTADEALQWKAVFGIEKPDQTKPAATIDPAHRAMTFEELAAAAEGAGPEGAALAAAQREAIKGASCYSCVCRKAEARLRAWLQQRGIAVEKERKKGASCE